MSGRRVMAVIESLQRGGAERLLVTTMDALDRDRWDPRVVALTGTGGFADELREMGVQVYELEARLPAELPTAVAKLRRVVRNSRIELVHTHLFLANVAGRLAARRDCPVVTTLHNPDYTFEDTGTLRFRLRKWVDAFTGSRWTDRFLAVSQAVREDYERHMPFDDIRVLYNYLPVAEIAAAVEAVDRERARVRHGLSEGEVAFLHVGRFHRQKAQDHLLRAFAVAVREQPGLRLLLAGDGPDMAEARMLAGRLGLDDAVVFLGTVEEVHELYAAADVFAFPSRWEAFGIALLEAMAAGLPAVVTDTTGIREVATGETARFVEVDHEVELARALLELAREPELRARLGDAGARRARDFDAALWVPRLEEVWAALLP